MHGGPSQSAVFSSGGRGATYPHSTLSLMRWAGPKSCRWPKSCGGSIDSVLKSNTKQKEATDKESILMWFEVRCVGASAVRRSQPGSGGSFSFTPLRLVVFTSISFLHLSFLVVGARLAWWSAI